MLQGPSPRRGVSNHSGLSDGPDVLRAASPDRLEVALVFGFRYSQWPASGSSRTNAWPFMPTAHSAACSPQKARTLGVQGCSWLHACVSVPESRPRPRRRQPPEATRVAWTLREAARRLAAEPDLIGATLARPEAACRGQILVPGRAYHPLERCRAADEALSSEGRDSVHEPDVVLSRPPDGEDDVARARGDGLEVVPSPWRIVPRVPTNQTSSGRFPRSRSARSTSRREGRAQKSTTVQSVVVMHPAASEHPARLHRRVGAGVLAGEDVYLGGVVAAGWRPRRTTRGSEPPAAQAKTVRPAPRGEERDGPEGSSAQSSLNGSFPASHSLSRTFRRRTAGRARRRKCSRMSHSCADRCSEMTSQPSSCRPLQSANPGLHLYPQRPWEHAGSALADRTRKQTVVARAAVLGSLSRLAQSARPDRRRLSPLHWHPFPCRTC